MTRFVLAAIILASTGCASLSPFPASRLLDRADALAEAGDYRGALPVYEEFLTKYPEHSAAPRARAVRELITGLFATRQELARVQTESARARQERDAELVRLRAETERLRADLEKLKRIDIEMEHRRTR